VNDEQDIDYWVVELELLLQNAKDHGFSIERSSAGNKSFVIYDEVTGRIRVIAA
jgi:hypothetical protein